MTLDECRDALANAKEVREDCEMWAQCSADLATLRQLKAARAKEAELKKQWDALQPKPESQAPAKPKAKAAPAHMSAIEKELRKHLGGEPSTEIIQGVNVEQVARQDVDLSVAFSPVIPFPGWSPRDVESTKNGTVYRIMEKNGNPWNVTPDELKVMRARYLLTRGEKYQSLAEGGRFDEAAQALFPEGVMVLKQPAQEGGAL